MGLTAATTAHPVPVRTTGDFGLKGPVKRIAQFHPHVLLEFDKKGRLTNDGGIRYVYDGLGRLAIVGDTYYSYDPDDRLHNPYCKYPAAALLDRNGHPITARKLISAHHMIGHPERGIKPTLVIPSLRLLRLLQALGALRRA